MLQNSRPIVGALANDSPGIQLRYWAETRPDAAFAACGRDWISYGELDGRARRLAGGLRALGLRPGDRVAAVIPNRDEFLDLLFANLIAGYVTVPLNTYLRGDFLSFQLMDCSATVAVVDSAGFAELSMVAAACLQLRHVIALNSNDQAETTLRENRPDVMVHRMSDVMAGPSIDAIQSSGTDLAAILYTSGTTGMPKGCMISHGYMGSRLDPWANAGWIAPGDVLMTPMPLFHGGAMLCILMPALQAGLKAAFDPAFSARGFTKRAAEIGATFTWMPGAMAIAVLQTPAVSHDRSHAMQRCACNPLRPDLQLQFEQRFGVKVLTRVFGQTELVPVVVGPPARTMAERSNSGKAVPGVEVTLVDDAGHPCPTGTVGEIVVSSTDTSQIFSGYWGAQPLRVVDGKTVHATGDLGQFDENGCLSFVDRKKDSIRRRGENVSAYELELSISQFPGVENVAVHAVTSELGEDEIKACIVAVTPGTIVPDELFDFLKKAVPYFAVPRFVEVMQKLPTNAMGRVMKENLRARGVGQSWDFEAMGLSVSKTDRRAAGSGKQSCDTRA